MVSPFTAVVRPYRLTRFSTTIAKPAVSGCSTVGSCASLAASIIDASVSSCPKLSLGVSRARYLKVAVRVSQVHVILPVVVHEFDEYCSFRRNEPFRCHEIGVPARYVVLGPAVGPPVPDACRRAKRATRIDQDRKAAEAR